MNIFTASHLLSVAAPPIAGGALAVADGRIVAVGTLAQVQAAVSGPVNHFPGCAIMPGLVNAHSHLELTHFPSWKIRKGIDYAPRTYTDWVIQVIKIRRSLTSSEREQSVLEGIRISLESGTTTLGEILSDHQLLRLYLQSPLAGRVYLEVIGHDPLRCSGLLSSVPGSMALLGHNGLQAGLSPHAPHTLAADCFRQVLAVAGERDIPLAIHLAESRDELDFLFDSTGPIAEKLYPFVDWSSYLPPPRRTTPTSYLDSLGLLRAGTAVIHCVHVLPAEVEVLRQRGVGVVLCPRSNDLLDVGKAPVKRLKKAGIPLAVGTDSLASNESLSLLDEARFLLRQFPDVFSYDEVLRMITLGGAEVLGVAGQVGSLEPEKRADFLVVELPEHPGRNLSEAIIERGSIRDVYLQGRALGSA
jgi:aminodeoxyfutalosine deaminase